MTKSSSTNIYLFYGEDDFSLRRKLDIWKQEFAKKHSSQSIAVLEGDNMDDNGKISMLLQEASASLFASKKLIIAKNFLPQKATQEKLAESIFSIVSNLPSDYFLVFWQTERLDRRLGFVKKFLTEVNAVEFSLPHGINLNGWIKAYAKILGIQITDSATELLAIYLGRDLTEEKKAGGRIIETKEAYNLWEVHSELSKLGAFKQKIDVSDVKELVNPKLPHNIFDLSDEIMRKNKTGAIKIVQNLLEQEQGDEKSSVIKIVGLLAEQARGLVSVAQLNNAGLNQQQIAEELDWTPGRVYIYLKQVRNFRLSYLKEFLDKLLAVDLKLKSSDENPRLLIDMLITKSVA